MTERQRLARMTGIAYLSMVVLGGFAHLGVRGSVHVAGDAVATAQNLTAAPTMFRLALVADIVMATAFVAVGVLFSRLLRHVDRQVAGVMVAFVAVGAGMILTNLVLHQAALVVATDPLFDAAGADQLVLLLLDLHRDGYTLAGIFFGLWLFPLAHLLYRSKMFPSALSVLLVLAGCSWIVDTVTTFLLPDAPELVHTLLRAPAIVEFWLVAYLLIKGVRPAREATMHPHHLHPRERGDHDGVG